MSSGTTVPAAAAGQMKYVDWVERVLQGLAAADSRARQLGVSIDDLQQRLTGNPDEGSPEAEAIDNALRDLEQLDLVDLSSGAWAELTQGHAAGCRVAAVHLAGDPAAVRHRRAAGVLRAAAALCEQRHPQFVLREVSWHEVNQRLSWPSR